MDITFLTLSPASIESFFSEGVLGRACQNGQLHIRAVNIRNYATDKHHTVDDTPYGGGAGMLLKPDIVALAIEDTQNKLNAENIKPYVILTSPGGRTFTQKVAQKLAHKEALIFVCGQYEGIDARINDIYIDDEISLGDFVISGGEIAAAAMANAVCRLLPNILGDDTSAVTDSHSSGLLEYPQYTRPSVFKGYNVPEVLLGGNHAKIEQWRWEQAFLKTLQKRPDMLKTYNFDILNKTQRSFIDTLRKQKLI